MAKCPICNDELKKDPDFQGAYYYHCNRCGIFGTKTLNKHYLSEIPITIKILISSYLYFFNMDENNLDTKIITKEFIEQFKNQKFPTPVEQMEKFILFIGDITKIPGKIFGFENQVKNKEYYKLFSSIPFVDDKNYLSILNFCIKDGFIEKEGISNKFYMLTLKGWKKYEELKKGQNNSHKAFMAMQYGNTKLDCVFINIIKPGLKELGFEINRLDKTNKSGLIDENLRVEIRDSKFLVVDLSDGNKGAYWEAGYGEGLNKKIFYICDKQKYEKYKKNNKKLVHFDVEHQNIYFWNENNLENPNKFIDSLKAGIRLAFPEIK